jgi:hypothetical protein
VALVGKPIRFEIPFEKGEWMELRRLTWRESHAVNEISRKDPAARVAKVLSIGIKAWSYDAEITPEAIEELDDTTAAWAMGHLMGNRTEDDTKNDSAPST